MDVLYNTMNDWTRFIEKWFNESQIPFADYEFNITKQELLIGFDDLTEDFDRVFNDGPNELELSESCMRVSGKNVRKELTLLHSPYPSNPRPNKNTRKNKSRKIAKPAPVQRRELFRVEKEGRESFEDVIVSDEIIKVVLQLPINNKRENIQVIAYSDNSITISYLSSEGKRSSRTSALPNGIDIETARSTYRNGILEITFDRK
ncbi:MAG TPA: Hsp20/alpha crystallin family protein [Nitrososphaeraceae archaeon]|nr:Hsp20/alpha crystallin family protein [Nitrososphaeraceae archaeon]